MPHHYSRLWLDFCAGAPLAPIWAWRDRADRLPSWAPALLAALEDSGCVDTAAETCGRPIRVVYVVCAMVPALRRAAQRAIARYRARQLPIGNSPIGESHAGESHAGVGFAHPLEALPMSDWLRLPHAEQVAVVAEYAGRRPRSGGAGDVRSRR